MAANRLGFPTPPQGNEDHGTCPVCGWKPCTRTCRLGLSQWALEELEAMFGPGFEQPAPDQGDFE